jgi:hypothetical protein
MGKADIKGVKVECEICFEKKDGSWQPLVYAALDAKPVALSQVIPAAKDSFADHFRFSKLLFIYASMDTHTRHTSHRFQVKEGLQLMGILEEVEELNQVTRGKQANLVFSAHFGSSSMDIGIQMTGASIAAGDSITFGDPFKIALQFTPEPSFKLSCGLTLAIQKPRQYLPFSLGLEIGVLGARGSATMTEEWKDVFGVKGLSIHKNLAMEIGIIYAEFFPTGLPSSIGFTGGLQIGKVSADIAINISEDPTKEILMGSLKELTMPNLLSFAKTITELNIADKDLPDFLTNPDYFAINDLKFYCAPMGGKIGEVKFEKGFSFGCNIKLFGKTGYLYVEFLSSGIKAKGHIDHLELGPLKITGLIGHDAELDLALTTSEQKIHVDGAFEFLGTGVGIYLDISSEGVHFKFQEKFFDLMFFTIEGDSTGSLSDLRNFDFNLSAKFESHINDYLKKTVSEKIRIAIRDVETDIAAAQKKVDDAEKEYKKVYEEPNKNLETAKADAKVYFQQCSDNLGKKKKELENLKIKHENELKESQKSWDAAIRKTKDAMTRIQTDFENASRNAQAAITKAETDAENEITRCEGEVETKRKEYEAVYNPAFSKLDEAQKTVNEIQNDINNTNAEYNRVSDWNVFEKGKLWTKIQGMLIGKTVATGVLNLAKEFLKGFKITSSKAAFDTATGVLKAANETQKGLLKTAKDGLKSAETGPLKDAFENAKQAVAFVQENTKKAELELKTAANKAEEEMNKLLEDAEKKFNKIGESVAYETLRKCQDALDGIKESSAFLSFEASKAVLEATKLGSTAFMKKLAEYLESHTGDILNIEYIKLSSQLSKIKKGKLFSTDARLSVLGGPMEQYSFDFDARDIYAFIEDIFNKVLEVAKQIVKAKS